MNIRAAAALIATLSLTLAACGGSDPEPEPSGSTSQGVEVEPGGSASEGGPTAEGGPTEDRGPVTQGDVDALGATLSAAGWGDAQGGCGESLVDMAGYPKVVCIIPDEYAVPGQDGNAVGVMTFSEWGQADEYVDSYGDPAVTVVLNGYIVDGPTSKAVDAAVEALGGGEPVEVKPPQDAEPVEPDVPEVDPQVEGESLSYQMLNYGWSPEAEAQVCPEWDASSGDVTARMAGEYGTHTITEDDVAEFLDDKC